MAGFGALMGGVAQGYGTVMNFKRMADEDKWREEERERLRQERAEKEALKNDLKTATAPAQVEAIPLPQGDDEGNVHVRPDVTRVNGVQFHDPTKAAQARAQYDAMPAQVARQAGVYTKHGMPVQAMQLNNAVRQDKLQAAQMEKAEREAQAEKFAAALVETYMQGGLPAVDRVFTENYGDGLTYKSSTPDPKTGAFTLQSFNADGTPNSSIQLRGINELVNLAVAKANPQHYSKWLTERADAEAKQRNADREFDANEAHRKGVLDNAAARLRIAEREAGASAAERAARANERAAEKAAGQMPQFDEGDARKTAEKALEREDKAREAAGRPLLTHAERAAFIEQGVAAHRAQWAGRQRLTAAANTIRAAEGRGPEAVASAWTQARKAGVPDDDLLRLGFKPPSDPTYTDREHKKAPPAAGGVRGAARGGSANPAANPADNGEDFARAAAAYHSYGSRQRQADPEGFAAAKAAYEALLAKYPMSVRMEMARRAALEAAQRRAGADTRPDAERPSFHMPAP